MKNKAKDIFEKILDFFYPPDITCGICGEEILHGSGTGLCPQCESKLRPTEKASEKYFGMTVYSCVEYEDIARKIVLQAKDSDKPYLTGTMAAYMTELMKELSLDADLLAYVPSTQKNFMRRGYEPMRSLAEKISRNTSIPVLKGLVRTKENADQTLLDYKERQNNIKNSFAYEGKPLSNERILLLDDIVTTGGTLNACKNALSEKSNVTVTALTFARS